MRESDLLSHIISGTPAIESDFPYVVAGPGHDCAVIATRSGERVLLKVDQLISGVHFRQYHQTPIDLIARKAIARPLSDIAAAGGTPLAALAAATLPADFSAAVELFDALAAWASRWRCPLVGGDTAILPAAQTGPLTLSITIIGLPHTARGPVLRSGAVSGDAVYVTGSLGGSLDPVTGLGRHLTFEPRLEEARWICDMLGDDLHAMMDTSDGLGRDASRLADASGKRIVLDAALFPRAPGVAHWRSAASDGEDYELLFAVAASASLPEHCPQTGTLFTRIGRVESGQGCVIRDLSGPEIDASALGWDHGGAGRNT